MLRILDIWFQLLCVSGCIMLARNIASCCSEDPITKMGVTGVFCLRIFGNPYSLGQRLHFFMVSTVFVFWRLHVYFFVLVFFSKSKFTFKMFVCFVFHDVFHFHDVFTRVTNEGRVTFASLRFMILFCSVRSLSTWNSRFKSGFDGLLVLKI